MIPRLFLISVAAGLCSQAVFAGEDSAIYATARKMAKAGERDFAYMQYQSLLRDYPSSPYAPEALFARGEYSFLLADYRQAQEAFQSFLSRYPHSPGALFALAHLLRIAQIQNKDALAKDLERQIVTYKQVSLVFRSRKEYQYHSPLNRLLKAAIHIDTIEIDVGGKLFVQISY